MTSVEEVEPEHAQDQDPSLGEAAPSSNGSFSESLRLFQSIQVLANEEDRAALQNSTAERVLVEADDYCFSSMMFTSVVGVVTVVLLMSGLSITLLCARLNRRNQESKESAADHVHWPLLVFMIYFLRFIRSQCRTESRNNRPSGR